MHWPCKQRNSKRGYHELRGRPEGGDSGTGHTPLQQYLRSQNHTRYRCGELDSSLLVLDGSLSGRGRAQPRSCPLFRLN